ncbi:helix-turn-helix transcriptional regulator [Macrococcus equipercicus]|uniref:Helix-turn-helix transcriptional regulator n=1 Tax=Macrococcus equipercicus TaxID=69967 RepID=A0ABQ6RAT3_9STAP|nr:metalloregulator ArsR/SmtB family transcription factor [Macrococcus equipercicus]KAA1040367.1 helix-turn-helix transcriptional regulator [Macrococcus equipercicus]
MTNYTCDVVCHNEEQVSRVKRHLNQLPMKDVTLFLKAIADENRSKIVSALCAEEELCVCDISCILDISIANASSHLRKLHKQGVVKTRKDGKLVHYSLDDQHVRQIMEMTIEHMEEIA